MSFIILKKQIIDRGLCVYCGTCIGICTNSALEVDNSGKIILTGNCSECGMCLKSCPGEKVDFRGLNKYLFDSENITPMGYIQKVYLAHSRNNSIRNLGSSGGVVTSLLQCMLKKKIISGAIVASFHDSKPTLPYSKLACSSKEILSAAGSKYVIFPHNEILRRIQKDKNGCLAFVGLPCHIHALRKLQQSSSDIISPIKYFIGLYCGLNLSIESIKGLFDRFCIRDSNTVKSIKYRDGIWPGDFMITLKNGKSVRMSKQSFNYLNFLYTPRRCLLCIDLSNEFSDLSVGDGWLKEGIVRAPGWSVVLVRNIKGEEIIDLAIANGNLELEKISVQQAEKMHSHGIDNKKKGSFIRMKLRMTKGLRIPDYNLEFPFTSKRRVLIEKVNIMILNLGRKKMIRKISNMLPPKMIEKIMGILRNYLLKVTKN